MLTPPPFLRHGRNRQPLGSAQHIEGDALTVLHTVATDWQQ